MKFGKVVGFSVLVIGLIFGSAYVHYRVDAIIQKVLHDRVHR